MQNALEMSFLRLKHRCGASQKEMHGRVRFSLGRLDGQLLRLRNEVKIMLSFNPLFRFQGAESLSSLLGRLYQRLSPLSSFLGENLQDFFGLNGQPPSLLTELTLAGSCPAVKHFLQKDFLWREMNESNTRLLVWSQPACH